MTKPLNPNAAATGGAFRVSAPDDGGRAFPSEASARDGMTLRDYFAAKVMQGTIANGALERIAGQVVGQNTDMPLDGVAKVTNRLIAGMVYEIADAMLAERRKS